MTTLLFANQRRLISTTRARIIAMMQLRKMSRIGKRRFVDNPHFQPGLVPNGFASRRKNSDDDALLQRICTAYIKSIEHRKSIAGTSVSSNWWRTIREHHLGPVSTALASRDIVSLRAMYQNFFRDRCSAGLVGLPVDMSKYYFGEKIKKRYRNLFLSDALHRLDLWRNESNERFSIDHLISPDIGNPFGVLIDGVFVRTGADYQHYYAERTAALLEPTESGLVAELGGGFGGLAYYLIRDRPDVTYIDFDVPESIALASYYLLKAFPSLSVTLYGEDALNEETLHKSRIVLMPDFSLPSMPRSTVDVFFSSYVLGGLTRDAVSSYASEIARTTRGYFFHLDRSEDPLPMIERAIEEMSQFSLVLKRTIAWNACRELQGNDSEYLYQQPRSVLSNESELNAP